MIRLERTPMLPEDYGQIFCEGFGEYHNELPQTVFIVSDNEIRIAFCSVYVHSLGNLYLQYIAFAKVVDPGKKYGYYIEIIQALHNLGFPYIMGAIHNKNKRALMWAIRSGFIINGARQATNGDLYVEVLHSL